MEGSGSIRSDFVDNPTNRYVTQPRDNAVRGAQSPPPNQSQQQQQQQPPSPIPSPSPINLLPAEIPTCMVGTSGVTQLFGPTWLGDPQQHLAGSPNPLHGVLSQVIISQNFNAQERIVATSAAMALRDTQRDRPGHVQVYRINFQADPSVLFYKSLSYHLISMGSNQQPRPPLLCKFAYTSTRRLLIDKINISPLPPVVTHALLTSRHGIVVQARTQDGATMNLSEVLPGRIQKVQEAFGFIRPNILERLSPPTRRLTIRYHNAAFPNNPLIVAEYSSADHSINLYTKPPISTVRFNENCADEDHFTIIHEMGHALEHFIVNPPILAQFNTATGANNTSAGPNPLTEYSTANTNSARRIPGYTYNTHEYLSEAFALWVLNPRLVATLRPAIANLFVQRFGATP